MNDGPEPGELSDNRFDMAVGDVDSGIGGVGIATAAMPFAGRNMMKSLQNPAYAATFLVLSLGCSLGLGGDDEMNLSFHLDRNQLVLDGTTIDGYPGRFVIGSAYSSTLIGSTFVTGHALPLTKPFSLLFKGTHRETVPANVADLGGEMDAIIGADVLAPMIVIDYRNGLVTRFSRSLPRDPDLTHHWEGSPRFPLVLDGEQSVGIVDTAVPDTLLVPSSMLGGNCARCEVDVVIAGVHFEDLSVRRADIDEIRIGNRVLEHFLVMIDYRKGTTSLEKR